MDVVTGCVQGELELRDLPTTQTFSITRQHTALNQITDSQTPNIMLRCKTSKELMTAPFQKCKVWKLHYKWMCCISLPLPRCAAQISCSKVKVSNFKSAVWTVFDSISGAVRMERNWTGGSDWAFSLNVLSPRNQLSAANLQKINTKVGRCQLSHWSQVTVNNLDH